MFSSPGQYNTIYCKIFSYFHTGYRIIKDSSKDRVCQINEVICIFCKFLLIQQDFIINCTYLPKVMCGRLYVIRLVVYIATSNIVHSTLSNNMLFLLLYSYYTEYLD